MVAGSRSRFHLRRPKIGLDDLVDIRDHHEPVVIPGSEKERIDRARTESLTGPSQLRDVRFFGSAAFRRLWFSQACSSLGDWIGYFAVAYIAFQITGGGTAEQAGAFSITLAARLVPGIFLSPFVFVILDRFNRKNIMVISDVARAVVLCSVPFVDSLLTLVFVSFVLEVFTLLYSPAKEASVPNLVKPSFLPAANSLSLVAAYGMAVPAAGVVALLGKMPEWFNQKENFASLGMVHTDQAMLLIFDALTYLVSATVIATLAIGATKRTSMSEAVSTGSWAEVKQGISFIVRSRKVRSVIIGITAALIGGAMVVPLGPPFATDVLKAGGGGYGLLLTAIGVGVAIGLIGLWVVQKKVLVDRAFGLAIIGAGAALFTVATMDELALAAIAVAILGVCAGAAYSLGFASLQANVEDEYRGRVFTVLYAFTRTGIVAALAVAPLLSVAFGRLSGSLFDNGGIELGVFSMQLPGVRLTLWFGALIMLVAGVFAWRSYKRSLLEASSE